MHGFLKALRRNTGQWVVMAALVLFAAAPTVDLVICGDDEGHAAASQQIAADDAGQPTAPDHGDGQDHACIHGHCHHAGAFALTAVPSPELPSVSVAVLGSNPNAPPPGYLTSGPERPPRA